MIEIKNACVTNTKLFIEDHDCFLLDVELKFGSGDHVVFGGYSLGSRYERYVKSSYEPVPINYGIYYIAQVFKVLEVSSLDEVKNKPCRVIFNDDKCVGIMNYLNDNLYFIPQNDGREGCIDFIKIKS